MKNALPVQQVGISGRKYLVVKLIAAVLIFASGLYFFAPNSGSISKLLVFLAGGYVKGLLVRGGVMVFYIIVQAWITFEHVLDTPLFRWPWINPKTLTLSDQFKAPHNDSHAWILVGITLSGLALVTIINASSANVYMFAILTKGVVGELLGDLFAYVGAYLSSIRSMDGFREWVTEKFNNSHVMYVVVVKLIFFCLCLSVSTN